MATLFAFAVKMGFNMGSTRVSFEKSPTDSYYLLLSWIVSVSVSAVALLSIKCFASSYALIAGTILFICFILKYRGSINFSLPHGVGIFGLILLLALVFRVQPYLWVMGGQDQGLYVNISEHYEKYGTPFVVDNVRAMLSNDAQREFDKTQHYLDGFQGYSEYPTIDIEGMKKSDIFNLNVKHNNPYAMHTSAVFMKDMSKSEYVFQFYPLHPLWMAICSKLFGNDNRVYSTVLFSLLSLISFYLLALELSGGSKVAGIMVATMLACNPLHAFFSKFPVTEIATLFFSSSGFLLLTRYYNESRQSNYRIDYLIISACLFFCMFITRISGFMYMPLFYVLLLWAMYARSTDQHYAWHIQYYSVAVIGLYAVSIGYGLNYSLPYSMLIYKEFLSRIYGTYWIAGVCITITFTVVLLSLWKLVIAEYSSLKNIIRDNLVKFVSILILAVLAIVLIFTLYLLFVYGYKEIFTFKTIAFISYVSPFAFVFFIIAVQSSIVGRYTPHSWLLVFLLLFLTAILVSLRKLPYQYYYARYLVSEIVPYTLLLVSLYWSALWSRGGRSKALVKVSLGFTCAYFIFFSSFQLQGIEADGAAQALQQVKNSIKKNELLLLGFDDLRLQTSFSYYYDLNTYRVDRPQAVNDVIYPELQSKFSKLYLVTKSPVNDQSLQLVKEIKYREGQYEHANHIPMKFNYINHFTMYLYEVDKSMPTSALSNALASNKIWQAKL